MALSGAQRTRIGVGGSGLAYSGFEAKSNSGTHPASELTRIAVGGSGRGYAGFTAKGSVGATPHPAFDLTRIAVGGAGRGYAGFFAKAPAIAQPIATGRGGGREPEEEFIPARIDEDEELMLILHAFLTTRKLH